MIVAARFPEGCQAMQGSLCSRQPVGAEGAEAIRLQDGFASSCNRQSSIKDCCATNIGCSIRA